VLDSAGQDDGGNLNDRDRPRSGASQRVALPMARMLWLTTLFLASSVVARAETSELLLRCGNYRVHFNCATGVTYGDFDYRSHATGDFKRYIIVTLDPYYTIRIDWRDMAYYVDHAGADMSKPATFQYANGICQVLLGTPPSSP
jgi:hypothetical protein